MKSKCTECVWIGDSEDMLSAQNPFEEIPDLLYACPKCRSINSVVAACDEPGCTAGGTCGTPVLDGYRWTCGKHAPPMYIKPREGVN